MRCALLAAIAVLLTVVLLAPPAAAMGISNLQAGAANFYTHGYVMFGWDDFHGGTKYDLRSDSFYILLKACYQPDGHVLPAFCFRDDPVQMAHNSTGST